MINLLLALTKKGDTVLLSSPECGGHASLPNIIKRLGLNIIYAPFDYPRYDYDYEKMNAILRENKVDMVLLAPSDLITIPDFKKIFAFLQSAKMNIKPHFYYRRIDERDM